MMMHKSLVARRSRALSLLSCIATGPCAPQSSARRVRYFSTSPQDASFPIDPPKKRIDYKHFAKLDIRVATIVNAELVEGADKLLKLTLDVGNLPLDEEAGAGTENHQQGETASNKHRTVFSGIKNAYTPEQLIGKQTLFLANLKVRNSLFSLLFTSRP